MGTNNRIFVLLVALSLILAACTNTIINTSPSVKSTRIPIKETLATNSIMPHSTVTPLEATLQIPKPTITLLKETPATTNTPSKLDSLPNFETILVISTGESKNIGLAKAFSVSPDRSVWIYDSLEPGFLFHFDNDGLLGQISLKDKPTHITDIAVTDSEIWLLALGNPQLREPKLIRLSFDGDILDSFNVPLRLFTTNGGEYRELGVSEIWLSRNGELLLNGELGLFQFLNNNHDIDVHKISEFSNNGYKYRIENSGKDGEHKTGILYINATPITITTSLDTMTIDLLGFSRKGNPLILLSEADKQMQKLKMSILEYSSNGEFQRQTDIPVYRYNQLPIDISSEGELFLLARMPDDSLQILKLIDGF